MKAVSVAQIEALIRLLGNEHMTPVAKRQFESVLEAAEDLPEMEHYSRALDEIFHLRTALAYEAEVVRVQTQDVKALGKGRKEILAIASERMLSAARGMVQRAYADKSYLSLQHARERVGMETLTRSQFEAEAPTR